MLFDSSKNDTFSFDKSLQYIFKVDSNIYKYIEGLPDEFRKEIAEAIANKDIKKASGGGVGISTYLGNNKPTNFSFSYSYSRLDSSLLINLLDASPNGKICQLTISPVSTDVPHSKFLGYFVEIEKGEKKIETRTTYHFTPLGNIARIIKDENVKENNARKGTNTRKAFTDRLDNTVDDLIIPSNKCEYISDNEMTNI